MKISQTIVTSSYRASDFTHPITATIVEVGEQRFDEQPRVYLLLGGHTKRLLLNRTNAMTLAHAFGDETDDWVGRRVRVWSEPTSFKGREVLGIRVGECETNAGIQPAATSRGQAHAGPPPDIYGGVSVDGTRPSQGVSAPDVHPD